MARRMPSGAGRSVAGWVAVVLAALWSGALALALAIARPVQAADRAGAWGTRHPLDDPPAAVARVEFLVGLVGVAALPVAVVVTVLGARAVTHGWVRGRAVGWVALVAGGLGLLPALAATGFGLLVCFLDGQVLLP